MLCQVQGDTWITPLRIRSHNWAPKSWLSLKWSWAECDRQSPPGSQTIIANPGSSARLILARNHTHYELGNTRIHKAKGLCLLCRHLKVELSANGKERSNRIPPEEGQKLRFLFFSYMFFSSQLHWAHQSLGIPQYLPGSPGYVNQPPSPRLTAFGGPLRGSILLEAENNCLSF